MKSPASPAAHAEPRPAATGGGGGSAAAAPAMTTSSSPSSQPRPHNADSSQAVLSPNKRRVPIPSSDATNQQGRAPSSSDAAHTRPQDDSSKTTKRARGEDAPPKTLPLRYELCAVEDVVELIANMLAELIATNDYIRVTNDGLTRFHSRTPPGISVRDYLHRLARHATLTPPLLLAMVYYIDRLCLMYPEFTINTLTVHRFLITAATVAAKGLSDAFWNNATYARVGGVRLAELKLLELEFLHRVDWKIVPDPDVLVAYYNGLVERTPGYVLEPGSLSDGSAADDDDDGDDDDDDDDDADERERDEKDS
ncbi:Cyclin [Geosmithia morbida]|uniref:Cyclin n=1 Tax=Geosmithia morbida TaxID=1094350 RepID=A0A9P5D6N9_9HYPO|nr:Cyclin [Geosmithia morbida]KAF4123709.1 Cyclin [Geosmithia morbida]